MGGIARMRMGRFLECVRCLRTGLRREPLTGNLVPRPRNPTFVDAHASRLRRISSAAGPILLAAVTMLCAFAAWSQAGSAAFAGKPTAIEIVHHVRRNDRVRAEKLIRYQSTRHYTVEYEGFPKSLAATMDVEVTFDAASGKSFRIISQSGSRLLYDKVLKRAVESEEEASRKPSETALTETNYRFQMLGSDNVNGRPAQILLVDPLAHGRFLYKGKISIDAADYALERIEAQPAKNPSFWITKTEIEEVYAPVEGFWLPQLNRSKSRVRFGGTAVLTIHYGTYRIIHR